MWFPSRGYVTSSLLTTRAGTHCTCLTLLMQNLSFVIVPLKIASTIDEMWPWRKMPVKFAKGLLLMLSPCSIPLSWLFSIAVA
jgi:hypothetical protein